jgi:hypothetical protein
VILAGRHLPPQPAHKFWNNGDDELVLDCWIKPANNAVFYLSTLHEATNVRKTPAPEPFVGAFLIRRYAGELPG